MKMLLFKMFFVVAVLLAVPYYMMGGGKMPAFLDDMFNQTVKVPKLPENFSSVVTDKDVTVYKWVDDQGRTHFSSIKPMNQNVETRHLRADVNIMQAVKIPEIEEREKTGFGGLISLSKKDAGNRAEKAGDKNKPEPYQMESPYSIEGIQNLIQGARNIDGMVNQRAEAQKRAVGR